MRLVLGILILPFAAACPGGNEPHGVFAGSSICEDVPAHIEMVCGLSGQLDAENVRQIQCDGDMPLIISREAAECVLRTKSCEDFAKSGCIGHVIIGCDEQSDCPGHLLCDVALSQCAACLTDEDCDDGKGCADGVCWDRDNPFFKLLK